MPASHVALFRGINLGGKNKISKEKLVSLFTESGAKNVQTYIQSGNVVFSAGQKLASSIPDRVCAQIKEQLGFETNVILRTAAELSSILARNPYPDLDHLAVAFLAHEPSLDRIALLDANRSPGDLFTVSGREIYLLVNSLATTKLTNAYFDSKLKTVSTIRNWRTVLALSEMMSK